jgi:hypothetical protein
LILQTCLRLEKVSITKSQEDSGSGTISFLGATDSNNGVTRFLTLSEIECSTRTDELPNSPLDRKLFPGHAIVVTNNGSVASDSHDEIKDYAACYR